MFGCDVPKKVKPPAVQDEAIIQFIYANVEICVKTCYNKYISHLKSYLQFLMTRDLCTVTAQRYLLRKRHKVPFGYLTKRSGAV